MDYNDNEPLFDDMPPAPSSVPPSGSVSTSVDEPDKNDKQMDGTALPSSGIVPHAVEPSETNETPSKQGEVMKTTAQQARERRESAERELEREREERADAKLKQLEDTKQSFSDVSKQVATRLVEGTHDGHKEGQ